MEFISAEQHPELTPGTYKGLASGYGLEILYDNNTRSNRIVMVAGVRGINCEMDVKVTEDHWVKYI